MTHPVIEPAQLTQRAEGVYAPLGFDPRHMPSSGAVRILRDDLRAHYGDAAIGGNVMPVIQWRLHPVVLRLHETRVLNYKYVFCTPLVGPLLDLVWYVQGAAPGNHPGWQLSNGSYFIYHHNLTEPIR